MSAYTNEVNTPNSLPLMKRQKNTGKHKFCVEMV